MVLAPTEPPDPDGEIVLAMKAQQLLAIGRAADALLFADRAIAAAPERAWSHALRGEALLQLGELRPALAASAHAIRLAPENACGYRVRALVLLREGGKSECLEMAQLACRLQASDPEMLHVLVQAQLLNGQLFEAETTAEELRKLAPNHDFVHEMLGLVALRRWRWPEAAEHFRRALALSPERFTSLNNLALCLEREGKYEEALETLHRAIRLAPADAMVRFNVGRVMGLLALRRMRTYLPVAGAWLFYRFFTRDLRGVPEAEAQLELTDWIWLGCLFLVLAGSIVSMMRSQRRLHPELRAFDSSQARKARPQLWISSGLTLLVCAGLAALDDFLRPRGLDGLTYVVCAILVLVMVWRAATRFFASARLGQPKFEGTTSMLTLGPVLIAWHKMTAPPPTRPLGWVGTLMLLVPSLALLALGLYQKRRSRI